MLLALVLSFWYPRVLTIRQFQCRDVDEILQPVATQHLHSVGLSSVLENDRAEFVRDFLQNLELERTSGVECPDLNLSKLLWDQLRRAVGARVTTTLADWRLMNHSMCDQAGGHIS